MRSGFVVRVQQVAAVKSLDPIAVVVEPVIEDIAGRGVAADTPGMLVTPGFEKFMPDKQGIDIFHLERNVAQPMHLRPGEQEGVLVDI